LKVFTASGTYPWPFVTPIFRNGSPNYDGDRKSFEMMTSILRPKMTLGSVASVFAATLYQVHPDRNHKLSKIGSTERHILRMQVLLECCYIQMDSSQFCRKVSFLIVPSFLGVSQGMKQT